MPSQRVPDELRALVKQSGHPQAAGILGESRERRRLLLR